MSQTWKLWKCTTATITERKKKSKKERKYRLDVKKKRICPRVKAPAVVVCNWFLWYCFVFLLCFPWVIAKKNPVFIPLVMVFSLSAPSVSVLVVCFCFKLKATSIRVVFVLLYILPTSVSAFPFILVLIPFEPFVSNTMWEKAVTATTHYDVLLIKSVILHRWRTGL